MASLDGRSIEVRNEEGAPEAKPMMLTESLLPTLEELARRAAEAEGVQVAWIELKPQGRGSVFRVFIEREDGDVGIADCGRVGERLSVLLDVEDPIESSYTLEVSSPGLDRPLHNARDFERFAGKLARVRTKSAVDGQSRFGGRLRGVEGDCVVLEDDSGRKLSIPLTSIERARLEVELTPDEKPRGRERGRSSRRGASRAARSSRGPSASHRPGKGRS